MTELRLGIIRAFDRDTFLADVELVGYQSTYLTHVAVAWHLREDTLVTGAHCVLLFFDELNPADAVVLAVLGGHPPDDPRFDPILGHKHRGLLRDGPRLRET